MLLLSCSVLPAIELRCTLLQQWVLLLLLLLLLLLWELGQLLHILQLVATVCGASCSRSCCMQLDIMGVPTVLGLFCISLTTSTPLLLLVLLLPAVGAQCSCVCCFCHCCTSCKALRGCAMWLARVLRY